MRDARLIVIASEGEKTEAHYFTIFRSTKLQVRVIPSEGGRSSPEHVLSNLVEFSQQYELGEGDQLWLAIDRDQWTARTLSQVAKGLQSRGWGLALSNPCFELWLALHFDDPIPANATANDLTDYLRMRLGSYNKSRFDLGHFKNRVRDAEERARELDTRQGDRWPQAIGSRVYLITQQFT